MLEKTEETRKVVYNFKSETTGECCVIFSKKNNAEWIQIGKNKQSAEKAAQLPFAAIQEVVKALSPGEESIKTVQPKLKETIIKDNRPTSILTPVQQVIESEASKIQQHVENTMKNADTQHQELSELGDELPTNLDIAEIEVPEGIDASEPDASGFSIDELARMGPVPETPPEFKQQLDEIRRNRIKKPSNPSKKIQKRD